MPADGHVRPPRQDRGARALYADHAEGTQARRQIICLSSAAPTRRFSVCDTNTTIQKEKLISLLLRHAHMRRKPRHMTR